MEARFGKARSLNSSHESSPSARSKSTHAPHSTSSNFFQRQWQLCRDTARTPGSKYNVIVSSILGFIASFVILVIFRPLFIMRKIEPELSTESEYLTGPPHAMSMSPNEPVYVLSFSAIALWSAVAACAIALLTYFTNRKTDT